MLYSLVALALAASANAAITILYPTSNTIWYKNDTVAMNWTLSDPAADTYLFRTILSNSDSSVLSGPQQIADSTNASSTYVRIALPGVPVAQGYIVTMVNTTNSSQVFAQSEAFEIQDGIVTNQTTSTSSGMTQSTSAVQLPNAATTSEPAFPTAPSAKPSNAASPMSFGALGQSAPIIALFGLLTGTIGATAVLF